MALTVILTKNLCACGKYLDLFVLTTENYGEELDSWTTRVEGRIFSEAAAPMFFCFVQPVQSVVPAILLLFYSFLQGASHRVRMLKSLWCGAIHAVAALSLLVIGKIIE